MNKASVNESRNTSWKGVHVSSHPGKRVKQPWPSYAVLAGTSVNLQVSLNMKAQHHMPWCRILFIPGGCVLQVSSVSQLPLQLHNELSRTHQLRLGQELKQLQAGSGSGQNQRPGGVYLYFPL